MKNLKTYLNACKNALKATIWSENNSNEGYYGLGLRQSYTELKQSVIQEQGANPIIGVQLSTTGKKVEKRLVGSNQVLKTWNTIAKAAADEVEAGEGNGRFVGRVRLDDIDDFVDHLVGPLQR